MEIVAINNYRNANAEIKKKKHCGTQAAPASSKAAPGFQEVTSW